MNLTLPMTCLDSYELPHKMPHDEKFKNIYSHFPQIMSQQKAMKALVH